MVLCMKRHITFRQAALAMRKGYAGKTLLATAHACMLGHIYDATLAIYSVAQHGIDPSCKILLNLLACLLTKVHLPLSDLTSWLNALQIVHKLHRIDSLNESSTICPYLYISMYIDTSQKLTLYKQHATQLQQHDDAGRSALPRKMQRF